MSPAQEMTEEQMREHLDNVLPGFTDAVAEATTNRSKLYVGIRPNEFNRSGGDLRTMGIAMKYASLFRVIIVGSVSDPDAPTRRSLRKMFSANG